jgi:hypothetical protein
MAGLSPTANVVDLTARLLCRGRGIVRELVAKVVIAEKMIIIKVRRSAVSGPDIPSASSSEFDDAVLRVAVA